MKDPCAPCGLCCRSYLVPLFGHDVWLLAHRRGLSPESFVFVAEQENADALGFKLTAEGPTYGLALMKQEPIQASAPCTFLEGAPDGSTRCGVYDDRPITCRSYPMGKLAGRVYQRDRTLCPPDAWDEGDMLAPGWRKTLQRLRRQRDIYVEAIARWNAAVDRWQPPAMLPPKLFADYLIAIFGKVAALEGSIGEPALLEIEDGWAIVTPRSDQATDEVSVARAHEPAWISHFRVVRQIIDGYFPELPPLPYQPLVVESGPSSG